ncbi:hypothetical protein [Bauldia sp.]|uniref:hypothetical protein n=1 Tax=Bauldia sp. TaxID=2575872 RepID=UPI003BA8E483
MTTVILWLMWLGIAVLVALAISRFVAARREPAVEAMRVGGPAKPPERKPPVAYQAMTIVVSVVVLGAALYVILSAAYAEDTAKWAYGAVGTVVGFWLKPPG